MLRPGVRAGKRRRRSIFYTSRAERRQGCRPPLAAYIPHPAGDRQLQTGAETGQPPRHRYRPRAARCWASVERCRSCGAPAIKRRGDPRARQPDWSDVRVQLPLTRVTTCRRPGDQVRAHDGSICGSSDLATFTWARRRQVDGSMWRIARSPVVSIDSSPSSTTSAPEDQRLGGATGNYRRGQLKANGDCVFFFFFFFFFSKRRGMGIALATSFCSSAAGRAAADRSSRS